MKLLALLPLAASAITVSLDADLKQMKESLRGIAMAAKQEGKQVNQTTIDVVSAMLTSINSTLVTALHQDKASAQATLDAALAAVQACRSARTNSFSGQVDTANTTQQNAHDDFFQCKNGEDAPALLQQKQGKHHRRHHRDDPAGSSTGGVNGTHDYGYNFSRSWHNDGKLSDTSHEVHAHTEEFEKCKLLNDTVKGYTTKVIPTNHSDYCEQHDVNNWTDLFRTNEKLTEQSYAWFSVMDAFEEANAQDYKDKRDDCHLARHRHQVRVVECNRLQHEFESAYCNYANAIDEVCYMYETCYQAQYAVWDGINTTAQNLEDQMKAQQHALEILLCYGNEIMQGETDLSNCDDEHASCDKCDDYCLNYTAPHVEIDCNEELETYRPCSDAWCTDTMGVFFDSAHPLDECVACDDPVLVAWSAD